MQKTYALMALLEFNKFDVKNLVVIGTDNTSLMVWINNGVYSKLKKNVFSLILF